MTTDSRNYVEQKLSQVRAVLGNAISTAEGFKDKVDVKNKLLRVRGEKITELKQGYAGAVLESGARGKLIVGLEGAYVKQAADIAEAREIGNELVGANAELRSNFAGVERNLNGELVKKEVVNLGLAQENANLGGQLVESNLACVAETQRADKCDARAKRIQGVARERAERIAGLSADKACLKSDLDDKTAESYERGQLICGLNKAYDTEKSAKKDVLDVAVARGKKIAELEEELILGELQFVSAEQAARTKLTDAEARNDSYRDAHIAACQNVEGLSYRVGKQKCTIQQKNERIKNLSADKRAILELALKRGEKITDLEIDALLLDARLGRQRETIKRLYKNQAECDELLSVYEQSLDGSRKHNAYLRRHIVELLDERYEILADLNAQRQQAVDVGARNSELERVTDELVESTVLSLKKLGFLSAVKDDYASRLDAAVEAVVSAEKRAVALENALAADEADIAKLERGYAAFEAERDAIVSEKLAVEKVLADGVRDWQTRYAESDRLADELIEANVGLQDKIAGARAEAGRQEVRAQYAEARNARFQDAHLRACGTVGQKNARISELESAVGRRDALLASHGLSLASAYENDLLGNITSALKTYTAGSGAEIDSYARSVVGRVCEKHLSAVDVVNVIKTLGRKEVGKEPVSDVARTFNAVLGRISSPAEIADLLCNLAHNKSIGVSLNRLQEAYSM